MILILTQVFPFQIIKEDLNAVDYALSLIKEDIEKTNKTAPKMISRFLLNLHSETESSRKEWTQLLSKLLSQIDEKVVGDQAGLEAHLHGCFEWLKELRSMLEDESKANDNSFSFDEYKQEIKVVASTIILKMLLFAVCMMRNSNLMSTF